MKNTIIITFLLAAALLSSGCTRFHAERWSSTNVPGRYEAKFHSFRGSQFDHIIANKGDLLLVSATAKLRSGELTVSLVDRSQTIWQHQLTPSSPVASFEFVVPKTAKYKISITSDNSSGEFFVAYQTHPAKSIQVTSNKNIELFGLLMQLDLGPDILANSDIVELDGKKAQWRDWYRVATRNFEQFCAHTNSAMMKLYRDYTSRGFYNDFFIGFLLQADEVPHAKLITDIDPDVLLAFSPDKNRQYAEKIAASFLDELNNFYHEVRFEKYLADNQHLYRRMIADVRKNLPPAGFVPMMESFYQTQFHRYTLVPSLNIPTSMGFGKMHRSARAIYNVFGPFSFQNLSPNSFDPGFDHPGKVENLSVHEFGHSFVNPAIDQLPPELLHNTEHFFTPIKELMTQQGYPSWTIALYEHFVRAGEVIIARKLGNHTRAEEILHDHKNKHYLYLPQIVAILENYAQSHTQDYPTTVRNTVEQLQPASTQ